MLDQILLRLRAALMPPAGIWPAVEFAEDIDVLTEMAGRVESGSCILMPWRERAAPNQLAIGLHRQRVEVQFAVGVVIRDHDEFMGETRVMQFAGLVAGIEAALAGWEPAGGEPCELVGGESSPISRGVSIYVQTWATARFLTGA